MAPPAASLTVPGRSSTTSRPSFPAGPGRGAGMRCRIFAWLLCAALLTGGDLALAASVGPTPEQQEELGRGALADRQQVDDAFGRGVAAYEAGDYRIAYEWWIPMARSGDPAAQRNIAHLYRHGQGVEKDASRAVAWYRRAADNGLARAQANLAGMYLRGHGVEENHREAAHWFSKAALQGHVVAQYNLGLMYMRGLGVERNEAKATGWFYLAGKAGHEPSLDALGKLVRVQSGPVGPGLPPNENEELAPDDQPEMPSAAKPDAPAADNPAYVQDSQPANSATVVARLARALQSVFRRNPETGYVVPDEIPSLQQSSDDIDGLPTSASSFDTARRDLLPLAESGDADAQYELARLHLNGEDGDGSTALGYFWMARAAANGHATAKVEQARLRRILSAGDLDKGERLLADWQTGDG